MNKIFKVIWSHATQTFVVVSELTRSKSKAKASVSDVKNGVSSLITSGFKLSAISSLLISAIPTAYAAVAINKIDQNIAITEVPAERDNGKAYANGTQSIAIGVNAGRQRLDTDKGSDGDGNSDNDYEKLSTKHLKDNTREKNNLISMGTYAFAAGHDSIAIGTNAQAVYENNYNESDARMTNNSKSSNNGGAVAIGFQAISRGDQSVALGSRAAARNRQSVAIGNDSFASGVGSVVIGGDDSSYVPGSTFLNGSKDYGGYKVETGFNPNPDKNYAPWYRPSAASGNGATVVGVHSQALSKGSTAVGVAATSGDGGKTSLVRDDAVEGGIKDIDPNQNIEATAVGALAHAQDRNTTAVGHAAQAIGEYSTSVGDDAFAKGKNSSAIGKSSYAQGNYSVAIGNAENTTNAAEVNASKVIANGTRAIAIGTTARTNADDTIAFGTRTESTAGGAISIGYEAKSKALDAIAIGKGAKALNTNTISIGTGNTVNGANSGAIGDPTVVNGTNSYSVGNNNVLASDNTFVLGNSVTLNTNAKNSTVIGNQNTINLTDVATNNVNTGYVNIQGDHNTINAARGIGILGNNNIVQNVTHDVFILGNNVKKTANDSVFLGSGSGYVVAGETTKGLEKTYTSDTVNDKPVQFAGGEVTAGVVSVGGINEKGEKSTRRIQNVAPGLISDQSTDAINGSQLYAVAEALKTNIPESKWNIKENTTQKDVVSSGDNVSFADGVGTTASVEVSDAGKTSTVKYSVNKSDLNVAQNGTVTAGNKGDNFATADQVADAINKSEKTTVINNGTTITATPTTTGTVTTYDLDLSKTTKDDIQKGVDAHTTVTTKGLTFTADAGTPTERKLGETLAINGDKALINTTVEAGKVSVAATKKLQDAVVSAESALQEIVTTVNGTTAQTVNKNSNKANFINGKNIELTPSTTGITVATKENVDFTTVNATTVNATTVNGDTIKSGNVVINQDGINAGDKKITHVADGNVTNDSKEAVNGSQLYATNQNVTNNTNNIAKNTADIAKGTVYAGDYAKDDSVKNEFTQALGNQTNVVGGASKDDLSDKNIGVVSNGANTLTVKLAKTLEGLTSATFGNDANDHTVINKDGVTITNGTDANKTVSLTETGLNNGGNKITNVAEGKAGTDAVNVDQLTKAITDSAYNWNISDGTNNTAVPDSGTVAVKGSANADSATKSGIVTNLTGTDITVDLSEKAKQELENGQKHSSVEGDSNVLVNVNATLNAAGGTQYDVKLADTVVIGQGDNSVTIDGTSGTVSGLNNLTWDPTENYTGGKAATQEQLKLVSDEVQKGWNVQTNNDPAQKVAPGETVKFKDGKNIKVTNTGKEITIATADNVVTTDTDKYVTGGTVVYNDKGEATATLTGNNGAGGAITGVKNNFVTSATTDANGKKATLTRNDGGTVDIDLTNTVNQAVTEATDKGTKYAGDKADTGAAANEFGRKLGETTNVKGGAQGELSDNNIGVVSNGVDTLTVKLAKALSGLTSATFGSDATDQTVINKDGVTINSTTPDKTVSLTETGLNNGGNKITNVAEGKAGTDAVNVDQLTKAITDSAYNWNISDGTNNTAVPDSGTVAVKGSANADSVNTVGVVTELEGTNVKVDLSQKAKDDIANGQKHSSVAGDTNFVVTQTTTNPEGGKQYDIKLADKVVIGKDKPVTIDGTNGTVSGLTNTTWDPNTTYTGGQAATQEQLKSVSDVVQNGWNIQANTDTATKVAPGDTVKFIDGENIKITRTGNDITVATAKDVKFDSVKVGDKVSINNDGINAGDTKVTNVTNGTLAADSKDAVNGSQLYATNQNVTNNAANITKNADNIAKGTVYAGDRLDAAVTGKTNNFTRALGEQTNVVGGATGELSDNNLAVISNGTDTLTVKLAKSLTDLTNATFGSTDMDKTVINKDGVTISSDKPEKEVSLTDKGLNNGNNQITNVTSGLVKRDGSSVELSKAEGDVLTNAVNVGDLKTTVTNLTEEGKGGGFGLTAEDNKDVKADLGKTVKVQGDGSVKTTIVEKDGQSALQVGLTENVTVGGQDKPGTITVKGENGKDGVAINGKDGSIGLTGAPGKDGQDAQATIKVVDGTKGLDGNNGKDGESKTRIVYEKPNGGGTEEIATLNDGLNFVGDKGQVIRKKLNETLAIKGNLDVNATVTDKNLRVDNDKDQNGELIIKMAKSLTDLTNATFSSGDINATIGGNGLTITPKGGDVVSLTDKGLNNGNNTITNVAPGVNGTDAVNKDQLDGVNATANAGWNLTTNGDNTNASNVAPNSTVDLANTDGNIVITKAGNNVTFDLNNNLTVGGPGKDGKDGVDGQLGVQGKDGKTGVALNGKDGTIGINGKDGSNGSITVKQGKPGVDGKDGETKTRIVYNTTTPDGKPVTEEVATLKDGLKFVGNDGKVVTKELNETLAIKGGINTEAGLTAASDRNVGVRENEKGLNIVIAERPTFSGITVDGKDGKDAEVKFAKDGKDGMSIVGTRGADGQNGLTLKGANGKDGVSFKEDGRITNVADGKDGKDAVNKDQLERVNATANAGWKLTINNGNNQTTVTPNATVDLANTDGNIVITKVGNNVNFGLNNTLTVGNDNKPGTMTVKGENGKDGVSISGKDGISIKGENGQDAVSINGKDGNGAIVVNGKDGKTGVGLDGANGTIGINGKDGSNGTITLAKGEPGVDGKDGKTRIVYETKTPDGKTVTEEVATLKDGLNFVGDKGKVIAKKLNETLAIKGNLAEDAEVTDKNLRVDNVNGDLIIKMAKSLRDLTDAVFTNVGGDKSVVTGNGLTITPTKGGNTVSLTTSGLDNGGNKVINVAAGDVNANSTDAVNGSQLYAVSEVANKGWNIQTNGNDTTNVKPGDTVNFVNGKNIEINNDGTNVTVGLAKDVDLGKDGSIKAGDTIMNNEGVKVGDNVSLTKDGLKAGNVTISATTGINAGDKQITNVASGLGGKKLSEAKGDTLTNAANIGDLQTAVSSVTDASQGGGFGLADDKGQEVKQNLGKTIAVKGDGKNISTVVKDGALTVNLNKDVDLGKDGSLTIGNTTINSDQVKVGDVTVSSNGKVSGVADGDISPNSTEAINGSQLYDANQNIANYLGGGSKLDDKGNVIAPTYTITKVDGNTTTANNVGDAITNLNNEVVKPLTFEGDTGVASKRKLGSTVTIKGGVQDSSKLSENNIGVVSDGKGTLAVKLAKDIKVDSVEAKTVNANTVNANTVKAGDTTINSDGVTIKDGPSVTKSGINAAGNRITNVKAGQADTDAVNVSQLKGAVGHVNQRINKVNKDLRAGIAGANAAAGLPQAYMPGKSMMAVAAGTYKNESALAVGYSRSSDNGKVILKLQGNANTRGDLGGSVGVGYQW
ncbi:YadA-like family protein [Actinobacillus pleuropneumoniae]|uniref:YadA-like family protein n=2 Tax=Actinobacillus pleuropneumoniae TaxID=715 RepID=UPI001F19796C|nr:YadA-like family protein [Actinobacillus pleuropneumoniae]UKH14024.1 adhesin [Actinobacillus pleuropneumoniae]UKH43215.1 adhesin [Actinobacillus pleuropneumoniae]